MNIPTHLFRSALAALAACALLLTSALLSPAVPTMPVPTPEGDAGFESIFDGKTLAGWDGDPKYWRVEDGNLVGEVTPATVMKQNTFMIWRGGMPGDFELKIEYRISAQGNSGLNFRSTEFPGVPFALRGYQFDIDGEKRNANDVRYTGQCYEERGRTFLALRGQMTRVVEGGPPQIIGTVGDGKALEAVIKNGDWNTLHIIARGNVITHLLNGQVLAVVLDDDAKGRAAAGLLGVQVHVGPPMKVEYRNFRLKKLDPAPAL